MFCIVCGAKDNEVEKLFCFPRNEERNREWQSHLGMKYRGVFSGHVRICNRHFKESCFIPSTNILRLKPNAVPTLLESTVKVEIESIRALSPVPKEVKALYTFDDQVQSTSHHREDPQPSILRQTPTTLPSIPSTFKRHIKKSIFKDFDTICSGEVSPKQKRLIGIVKKKHKQLRKVQKECKSRGKAITDLENIDKSVAMNNLFKKMSPAAINLMIGQVRCTKRTPQGRRWSLDEKITALSIYKRSPKCYALLQRLLILPSKGTLEKLLQKLPITVGINKHLFSHLGECLKSYEEKDRLCCLAFDEITIREHIQYNRFTDCIDGVEDFGEGERTEHLARYALVFLAQGIVKSWKQPLAYYFSRNGVSSEKLRKILLDILNSLHSAEIPVIATVCNMVTSNVKTLKALGCTSENPFFTFQNKKIYTFYDIPHLLKCFRNLFCLYPILVHTVVSENTEEILEAKWEDIEAAYQEDNRNPLIFRSLYKIKDYYLAPLGQIANNVKIAAQTLSRSVSVYLFNLVSHGVLPSRALATATFINDIDATFDSLNGYSKSPPDGKPFSCLISENSKHTEFWETCKNKIERLRFIRKSSDMSTKIPWKPPSQQGWLHSLQAFILIWNFLKSLGLTVLNPRHLNQDALENLFGSIRSNCGNNENPTVSQFEGSLKTQIINGLTNQALEGSNCEEDQLKLLSNLQSFLQSSDDTNLTFDRIDVTLSNYSEIDTHVGNLVKVGSIKSLSVAYVSGYIIKKLFQNFYCKNCTKDLSSDDSQPFNQFISLKEFSDKSNKLYCPSEKLTVAVGYGITLLEKELPILRKAINLKQAAIHILSETLDFSFLSCTEHFDNIRNNIIEGICGIVVPWYCTRMVQDIKTDAVKEKTKP